MRVLHVPGTFQGCFLYVDATLYILEQPSQSICLPKLIANHTFQSQVVTIDEDGKLTKHALGTPTRSNLNVSLQAVVSPGVYFGAYPTLDYETVDADGKEVKTTRDPQRHYSLVGCTVAPAFDFADFELAQRDPLLQKYPQHSDIIERLTVRDA